MTLPRFFKNKLLNFVKEKGQPGGCPTFVIPMNKLKCDAKVLIISYK